MAFTRTQQVALAIMPKVTGILSIMGSSWIVIEVLTRRQKRRNVYNRILCAMSIFDVINTSWFFASTWPIPEGTPGVAFPIGNQQTCVAQGFFLQFGMVPPIYNASLSIYYLLVVKHGVSEKTLKCVEPFFHLIPISFGFATGVTGLALDLYNNANLWCWIAPYPPGCQDSWTYGKTTCTRGDNAWIYRWAFFFAPLWFCILFVTIVMVVVYVSVRRREHKAIVRSRPSVEHGESNNKMKHLRHSSFILSNSRRSTVGRSSFRLPPELSSIFRSSHVRTSSFALPKDVAASIEEAASGDSKKAAENNQTGQNLARSASTDASEANFVLETIDTYRTAHHQNLEANQFGSRVVFRQSILYTCAFYATFTFATLNRLLQQVTGKTYFTVIFLHAMFIPLQGFFNVLVYRYAFFSRLRHRNPHMSDWDLFINTWRWSVLGPPPGNRKSALDSSMVNGETQSTRPAGAARDQASDSNLQAPIKEGGEKSENMDDVNSDAASVLDNLRCSDLADDALDGMDNGELYDDMASELMVSYSEFPNILSQEVNMVSTRFPKLIVDDSDDDDGENDNSHDHHYAFHGFSRTPHSFPSPMMATNGAMQSFPMPIVSDFPQSFPTPIREFSTYGSLVKDDSTNPIEFSSKAQEEALVFDKMSNDGLLEPVMITSSIAEEGTATEEGFEFTTNAEEGIEISTNDEGGFELNANADDSISKVDTDGNNDEAPMDETTGITEISIDDTVELENRENSSSKEIVMDQIMKNENTEESPSSLSPKEEETTLENVEIDLQKVNEEISEMKSSNEDTTPTIGTQSPIKPDGEEENAGSR